MNRDPGNPARSVLIVGLGLLGGSLGLALRGRGWLVRGLVRRPEACAEAKTLGVVDEVFCTPAGLAGLPPPDVVVLGVPIGALGGSLEALRGVLPVGTVITDVSSVKAAVMPLVEPVVRAEGWRFIGGHPMAGAETSGMAFARGDLFSNAWVALCAGAGADGDAMAVVGGMWEEVGGRCLVMDGVAHDRIVARTSHLPHLVASLLVLTGIGGGSPEGAAMLAAGGFRDSTRIAAGPPMMWREIMASNHRELGGAIREFGAMLERVAGQLERGEWDALEAILGEAARLRRGWRGSGEG